MEILTAMKKIDPDTTIQRKGDLLFNTIDEEVVILSVENSEYYGLEKVGSRIWELLEHPISFRELISKLMKEFDVSEEQCTTDTLTFLIRLGDKKLITGF
jgi:hypothetical protein